ATYSLLCAMLDKVIEHRPHEPRLDARAHSNIGCRLPARSGLDTQRIVGSHRHKFVEIGSEDQFLVAVFALDGQLYGEKGNSLELETPTLGRRTEPIAAIGFPPQGGGEELDQG